MSKLAKLDFKIKLTTETSEKLRHEESNVKAELTHNNIPGVAVEEATIGCKHVETNKLEVDQEMLPKKPSDISIQEPASVAGSLECSSSAESPDDEIAAESTLSSSSANDDQDDKSSFETYAQYIHYEGEIAVYTDPSTKVEYIWCSTDDKWVVKTNSSIAENVEMHTDNVVYENGVATYTDKDGTVFFWDNEKNAWFPKVDDDFLAKYQMSYGFVDNTTESTKEDNKKVEKLEEADNKEESKGAKRKNPDPPKWFEISDDQNTSVYVSNLPLDITEEEFVDLMQKCGLVMRDPTTQKMKIKLYTKPNSKQLKGDALCTYIKIESVELAENILDGYAFKNHRLQVQKAHFEMKGEYNPALKPKKKKRKEKEKIKKMQEKLFDWRPEKFRGERSKHEKVVIIKNLFEPKDFDKEVHLILEYQEDIREECAKLGEVRKVSLYDRHPEGVAQVIMKEPEEADNVVKMLNGRWFGKRQLSAAIWDGKTKYKMEETDADLNKRLDGWDKFLEQKDDSKIVPGSAEIKTNVE